jgi:hypothetical protein
MAALRAAARGRFDAGSSLLVPERSFLALARSSVQTPRARSRVAFITVILQLFAVWAPRTPPYA